MTRIDAHHHVWDLSVRDQPWTAKLPLLRRSFDLDELTPELAHAGIDRTVLVQTIVDAAETPELLALAAANPVIAGVVGWVDLESTDVADALAALRAQPGGAALVGIRHQVQGEPNPAWLEQPDVLRGLAAVGDAGLAYDLLVTADQLPAAITAARSLPDVRFVLDHAGNPDIAHGQLEPWSANVSTLASLPNVAVKLSGLTTRASQQWTVAELTPFVDVLLDSFGTSRIMFGSDWPVSLLAASYADTIAAAAQLVEGVSTAEHDEVFGLTAASWYGLSTDDATDAGEAGAQPGNRP
jgi:L-fuconolactonase